MKHRFLIEVPIPGNKMIQPVFKWYVQEIYRRRTHGVPQCLWNVHAPYPLALIFEPYRMKISIGCFVFIGKESWPESKIKCMSEFVLKHFLRRLRWLIDRTEC